VWLLAGLGLAAFVLDAVRAVRERNLRRLPRAAIVYAVLPLLVIAAAAVLAPGKHHLAVQAVLTVVIVTALGPPLYRVVFQPVAHASVLTLLIISVALHFVLSGLSLAFFGAEGSRTPAFTEASFTLGGIRVTGQQVWVLLLSAGAIACLFTFFRFTFRGKTLRATAIHRLGASLMGISPAGTGSLVFTLAAGIGCVSGILIGPFTTIFYDTGFLIGLKGFVAAIVAGLVSYPAAAVGALVVGVLESFAAFQSSAFKEVIVFSLMIPVLIFRSLTTKHVEEDAE
jgi:branched-chain amino acid transport system permease protein